MLKNIVKKISIVLIIFFLMGTSCVWGDDINTGDYTQIYNSDSQGIKSMGEKIVGLVQVIGVSVATIMIVVIAIRYFISSPDQKADVKSKLIPFLIGALLLFGASGILSIVVTAVQEIFK